MIDQSKTERAELKRSFIMKVGSAVLGVHIAAVCALVLSQGCVTSESQGSGRGAGARHKGVGAHIHRLAKQDSDYTPNQNMTPEPGGGMIDDSVVMVTPIQTTPIVTTTPVEPYSRPSEGTGTYTVQKGDTLSGIAQKFGTKTKTLINMNNLSDPNRLYVGQEINVPGGSQKKSSSSTKSGSSSAIKRGGTYEIQKGDSLSKIASRAGVSVSDLKAVNNMTDDKIFAGEKLVIPSYGKVPSSSSSASTAKSTPKKATVTPKKTATPEPVIPEMETAPVVGEPATMEPSNVTVSAVHEHLVHQGDTLESIARSYGVSKDEIMRYNNLTGSSDLRENMTLRIPIR